MDQQQKTKIERISNWLKDIYGDDKAPEIAEGTLDQLFALMEMSQKEEETLEIIGEFQQLQIAEFKQETSKLRQRMECLGFDKGDQPMLEEEIDSLSQNLAICADLLGLDDPTEFSLDLAITDLRKKAALVPIETYLKKSKSAQGKRAILRDITLLNKTHQSLTSAKTEKEMDEATIAKTKKSYQFMQEKEKQYTRDAEKYVTIIKKTGYNKATTHDGILQQQKKLNTVLEKIEPVSAKLDAYKGLPASLELATAELSQKEQHLEQLKGKLQNEVEKIQL